MKIPVAVLRNTSGADLTLSAGDIIYNVAADTQEASGIYWIQNTVKRPIPDSRYAFCVTSDKYIQGLTDAQMKTFQYSDVEYTIPSGGTLEVSLSHRPIFQWVSPKLLARDRGQSKRYYRRYVLCIKGPLQKPCATP